MTPSSLLALTLVTLAGAAIAVQGPVNAALAKASGGPVLAACLSFLVGFIALAALSFARGPMPPLAALATAPAWAWIGGLLGALYVAAAAWSVPQLGVVSVAAAAVLGQVVAAVTLDAVGGFGLSVHPVSVWRILSIVLVVAGLVMSRVG